MHLTMVGTGYVGLVTGACFAETGNHVTCLDVDARKIETLRRGESPIYEPGLTEMLQSNIRSGRIRFTLDKLEAYRDAEAIFICVGTPSDEDGSADLQYVLAVARDIGEALERIGPGGKPKVVVVKSTVPVGTSHAVRDAIRAITKVPFHVADNPEFLKEGDAINDFMKPDRIVCGVDSPEAAEVMRALYEPFVRNGNPIYLMDVRSAEMVKYASNAMLAAKISFINEIANLCERMGADVVSVREGMCADRRIGNQFLYPGLGYGGSCFPKDTQAVVGMGRAAGLDCKLNAAVHAVNQDQRAHFWAKVDARFGGAAGL
jgi:UDPglucose 6-dehydrogenase